MTAVARAKPAAKLLSSLFRPRSLARLLRKHVPFDWERVGRPCRTHVDRCWPVGDENFAFEWSFRVADHGRLTLFGRTCLADKEREYLSNAAAPARSPRLTSQGMRGLFVHVPESGLMIHSPDTDPRLSQLATCLDGTGMAARLKTETVPAGGSGQTEPTRLACELQGYRAGRRATISYQRARSGQPACIGKTFSDGRGEALVALHARLRQQWKRNLQTAVDVPTPITYLPDLHLALFQWSPGSHWQVDKGLTHTDVRRVLDALAVLHGTPIRGLSTFGAKEECAVIERWFGVLRRLDADAAASAAPIVDALCRLGERIPCGPVRTIHRDFYERQVLLLPDRVILLDLDTLSRGDPAVDLGNFLAHALLLAHRRGSPRELDFGSFVPWCRQQYERWGDRIDRTALEFQLAASLFRLGAVHHLRTTTRGFVPFLWSEAIKILRRCSAAAKPGPFRRAAR